MCSVLWFNLGMHHVPTVGDLPHTLFQNAQSSIVISPFNYLDSSPLKRSNQVVEIRSKAGRPAQVKYNRAQQLPTCLYNMVKITWAHETKSANALPSDKLTCQPRTGVQRSRRLLGRSFPEFIWWIVARTVAYR
jgi:hypothetical protein